jgi:hypothetical protein
MRSGLVGPQSALTAFAKFCLNERRQLISLNDTLCRGSSAGAIDVFTSSNIYAYVGGNSVGLLCATGNAGTLVAHGHPSTACFDVASTERMLVIGIHRFARPTNNVARRCTGFTRTDSPKG